MRQSLGWAALAAAVLAFAPPRAARADDATDQFKAHVQAAKVHYDLGEFDDAAEEYIQAYRIKPVAGALFNIAQAYRQAGKYDKSRQFYRSYLREANPDAKGKATVEKQIHELDELIAKEEKTKNSAPTGVENKDELAPPTVASNPVKAKPGVVVDSDLAPPPIPAPARPAQPPPTARPIASAPAPAPIPTAATPPPKPSTKIAVVDTHPRPGAAQSGTMSVAPPAALHSDATIETQQAPRSHTVAYVLGGAAVALLGGGAFFGIEAARADNELTAGPHYTADADTLINTSKSDHTLSAVFLAAGAVAAVGAGVLFFLPTSGPSGGSGASVAGHF